VSSMFAAATAPTDAMLSEMGMLDTGDLVLRAQALLDEGSAGGRATARFATCSSDELEELDLGPVSVARALAGGDDDPGRGPPTRDQAIQRFRAAAGAHVQAMALRDGPSARGAARGPAAQRRAIVNRARAVVQPVAESEQAQRRRGRRGGVFWRCANEPPRRRARADVEACSRPASRRKRLGVLVRSVRREGKAVASAREGSRVAFALIGPAGLQRAEIRDGARLAATARRSRRAGRVVRALAVARSSCARSTVARLHARSRAGASSHGSRRWSRPTESPRSRPEARDRILGSQALPRRLRGAGHHPPDLFVHRDRAPGLRRQQLFGAQADVVERLVNLASRRDGLSYVRRAPQATPREFARTSPRSPTPELREEEAETATASPAASG